MEIRIKVTAEATKSKVVEGKGYLSVFVKAKKKNSEANEEVVKTLSKYFLLKEDRIKIKRGKRSQNKLVEIKK